ncbi:MAG: hypothetical protein F2663_06330 [Actinobacteria bacterium]|uniref:Unannotated protein n=1 Tax=freshwater metagenome TaxID=449393 RepID=A0A6J6PM58_9ZZZZ|nr:hypothetical protein [Actinomycetota bacterium]
MDAEANDTPDEETEAANPDLEAWFANAPRVTCPACGFDGAVTLGGGAFCPSCEKVSPYGSGQNN